MENIIYFNHNNQFENLTKILNTIGPCNNNYTFDFFEDDDREKNINNILNFCINDEKPIILIGSSKSSVAVILYASILKNKIKNQIILLLFSPFLTLNEEHFKESIQIGSLKNEFENKTYLKIDIIIENVMIDNNLNKIIIKSENDDILPKNFNSNLISISKNLRCITFKNTVLHNLMGLFWYGYSKNFNKFYNTLPKNIQLEEAQNISRIWEKNNNLDNLLNNLIKNDYKNIRKDLICFEFIEYILY